MATRGLGLFWQRGLLSATALNGRNSQMSLVAPLTCRRFQSTNGSGWSSPYDTAPRAAPEALPKAAVEIWTERETGLPSTSGDIPPFDPEAMLDHPAYTPLPKPDVSVRQLVPPLRFPEFDQRFPSTQSSGLPSPPAYYDIPYDVASEAPTGPYPRLVPQWTQLKDPFKYWDQQGRRNYGDLVPDHFNFMDQWSVGPVEDYWHPLMGTLKAFGTIGLLAFLVYLWDPASHAEFAPKEFPYDGLRVQMGGDPEDAQDNWMSAHHSGKPVL